MVSLSGQFYSIQGWLLPELEEELGELTKKQCEFVRAVELLDPIKFIDKFNWIGVGRKPSGRLSLLKAFIAKPIFQYAQTSMLIDNIKSSPVLRRLCGWETRSEVPSESTFSRAFSSFAKTELAQVIYQNVISSRIGSKLFGHKSTDSTSVKGREKSCRKNKPKKKGKRGRPKKGTVVEKEPRRLELQLNRTLRENLEDLPAGCDWGGKLHLDCVDGDIPVSAVVTSASVHDSQVAIPLSQMSKDRVANLYDIMDSAYDSPEIHQFSLNNNRIPIIDNNPRRGEKKHMCPAKAVRYNERTAAERVNSELKDNYALETIRVKGHKKVSCHIMFAVLALAAKKIFKLVQ